MKTLLRLVVVLLMVTVISSCSQDEPTIEQKAEPFKKMIIDKGEATYKRVNLAYFQKDPDHTNNQWEEVNLSHLSGFEPDLPVQIYVKDGCSWAPSKLSKFPGSDLLMTSWGLYCDLTGKHYTVYISTPIELSEDNTQVIITGHNCEILGSSANGFTIQCSGNYWYGEDWKIGEDKEIYTYEKIDTQNFKFDEYLCFNTEREVVIGLVSIMRDYFGNEFNLNDYSNGINRYNNSIVNFDLILERLLKNFPKE
ncbi:MAG: hypothetical protein NC217_01245 [Muribaculaceae bacterium]|nr:hypothetical protein [Muribaculaceae bacterium]